MRCILCKNNLNPKELKKHNQVKKDLESDIPLIPVCTICNRKRKSVMDELE